MVPLFSVENKESYRGVTYLRYFTRKMDNYQNLNNLNKQVNI